MVPLPVGIPTPPPETSGDAGSVVLFVFLLLFLLFSGCILLDSLGGKKSKLGTE